jgi:hypothetical protein
MNLYQQQQDSISTLLANIIDQGNPVDFARLISLEDIPERFKTLRLVYQAIQLTQDKGLPPDKDNVAMALQQEFKQEDAADTINRLLENKGRFGNIEHLSVWIKERQTQIWYEEGAERIRELLDGPRPMMEKAMEAAVIWDQIQTLYDSDQLELDAPQRFDYFLDRQRYRHLLAKEGHSVGPSLKFEAFVGKKKVHYIRDLKRMDRTVPGDIPWSLILKEGDTFVSEEWLEEPTIPVLPNGDMTLITAEPKRGKSTLAQIIGEHNAHVLGHYVVVLQMETDQDTSEMRALARNLSIRRDAMSTGNINPDDTRRRFKAYKRDENNAVVDSEQVDGPTIKEHFDWYRSWLASRPGKLVHVYCPGWSVFRINQMIRMMSRLAHEDGKQLLVIIDYYNLISREGISGDSEANILSAIAQHLKTTIAQTGSHAIVFAQETPNNNGDPSPYGSRGIQQKCQIHLTLTRYRTREEFPVTIKDVEGKAFQKRDALGNLMYWCKKGDVWDSRAILKIVFANDHAGTQARIMFVNSYYGVVDAPSEFIYTDESMKALEKSG